MQLDNDLAMMVVERLERIQPHKVVVINESGVIVGASDRNRIGRYHPGAVKRMQLYHESGVSGPQNMMIGASQRGQGACILMDGKVAGVIGLSGTLDQTSPFLGAAESIVQLMLERELLSKELFIQNSSYKNLLLSLVSNRVHDREDLLWKLKYFDININVPRTIVLIHFLPTASLNDDKNDPLAHQNAINELFCVVPRFFSHPNDLILCNELQSDVLVLCADRSKDTETNRERIQQLCVALNSLAINEFNLDGYTVIGEQCSCFDDYFGQYRKTRDMLHAGRLIFPEQRYYFGGKMILGNVICSIDEQTSRAIVENVLGNLLTNNKCDCYLETMSAMFQYNMSIDDIAKNLYIHRNTLQYRFRRIYELTGYNPYDIDGMVTLRIAYLCYKQQHSRT